MAGDAVGGVIKCSEIKQLEMEIAPPNRSQRGTVNIDNYIIPSNNVSKYLEEGGECPHIRR